MAIGFPLGLAAFFRELDITRAQMHVPSVVESSETQSGEIITVGYGPSLWMGDVTALIDTQEKPDEILSQIELLLRPDTSFFVSDATRRGPQLDRQGLSLGATVPKVDTRADNSTVGVSNLPAGYVLTAGDLISFRYGANPVRYALHRVVKTQTATAVGVINILDVHPLVQPGLVDNTDLVLVNPYCKAKIIPGSYQPPDFTRARRSAFSFSWRQTLR